MQPDSVGRFPLPDFEASAGNWKLGGQPGFASPSDATEPAQNGEVPVPGGSLGNHGDTDRPGAPTDERAPVLASASADERRHTPIERRVVVYNATLGVVVNDVAQGLREAEKLASDFGGYAQRIELNQITIRVPAARYQDAVALLEKFGRLVHRQVESLDVTEEYVDLQARLHNAQAVHARLRAMLEKAEDVKTALEVEKELKRLNEEIETLTAKLDVIRNRIAYSTITIVFRTVAQQTTFARDVHLPFTWLRALRPEFLWN